MNPDDDLHETELRRLFAERQRRDEAASPGYERVIHGQARVRGGGRRLVLAACAAAGFVLVVLLTVFSTPDQPTLSTWKAPTDFLLDVPGGALLNSTPAFPDPRRL